MRGSNATLDSRLLIDGDRFRTESPEGNYEGIFNINVETTPHEIDIEFVEGPEAGNWNYGIFRINGDHFELCLDLNGKPRPQEFKTSSGKGHAYEVLSRTSEARPENVTGGTAPQMQSPIFAEPVGFDFVESQLLARLQGNWTAVQLIRDGQELPSMMLKTASRTVKQNQVQISFGGKLMIQALMRIDESTNPMLIDYYNMCGHSNGMTQLGIMKWEGNELCQIMAAPNQPRPMDFQSAAGSGTTYSRWRLKE